MHNNFLSLYHNINCQFDITTNVRLKKKTIKIWKNYVHHRPASRQFRQMFSSTLSTIVFFFNEPVHKTLYIRVAVLSSWIGFPASVWVNIKKLNIFISYSHHKFLALLTWHFPVIPQLVSCDSTNDTSIRYTCFHKKGNCFGNCSWNILTEFTPTKTSNNMTYRKNCAFLAACSLEAFRWEFLPTSNEWKISTSITDSNRRNAEMAIHLLANENPSVF